MSDSLCDAWASDVSIIPADMLPLIPSDHFFIKIVAEFSSYLVGEDDDVTSSATLERNDEHVLPFVVPAEKLVGENSSWATLSNMLSQLHIPLEDHPHMLYKITHCARTMAHATHASPIHDSRGSRILPMIVSIYMVESVDYDSDGSGGGLEEEEEAEGVVGPRGPTSKEAVEGLETVEVEAGGSGLMNKECVVCQEEILGGLEVKRMPCEHVFHGDCIVKWLGVSNFCPLCRFQMPTRSVSMHGVQDFM